jgi:hypothetical protein
MTDPTEPTPTSSSRSHAPGAAADLGELWPVFLIAPGLWILFNAARRTDRL